MFCESLHIVTELNNGKKMLKMFYKFVTMSYQLKYLIGMNHESSTKPYCCICLPTVELLGTQLDNLLLLMT